MEPKIATVSQINGYIKKIFDANIILNDIWIKGEISNFKLHYSGHMYITLKDEGGVLKAVMFKSAASSLNFRPEDGMKVLARGRISVYEAGGAYQLYINELVPDGVGELYIAYEQLKKRLEEEGLFAAEHKKELPAYPEHIGVITAATGAAVRDIINVITRRYPYAEIILYPSLVQGAGAAENICRALKYFNDTASVDVIIAGRGGGSIEDLWAFNEEPVARAIYASRIPVISAVGHETDFTIADFAADMRAPTPSAAAELAVPSQTELIGRLMIDRSRITNAMTKRIKNERKNIDSLRLRDPKERIEDEYLRLDNLTKQAEKNFKIRLISGHEQLGTLASKLDALSPLKVMVRGYSLPINEDGKIIKSADELLRKKSFDLKMADGTVCCTAKEKR